VTWTSYPEDGTAYIYGAYSSDYGEHFSAPVLISSDSALCSQGYGIPTPHGRCKRQPVTPQPVTAADGTLYVAWANYNTANPGKDNRFQVLLAHSVDGGKTFSAPVKATDYYDLPDCDTYQGEGKDPGRDCVPEKVRRTNSVFRATNYPNVTVDPANPKRVVVTTGSYINRDFQRDQRLHARRPHPRRGRARQPSMTAYKKRADATYGIVVSSSTNGAAAFPTGTTTDVRKPARHRRQRRPGPP